MSASSSSSSAAVAAASSTSPALMEDDWGAEDGAGEDDWGDAAPIDEGDEGWGTADVDSDAVMPQVTSPVLTRQQSYIVLDNNALTEKQEGLIRQTAEVLFVTPAEAGCLLRHYGWKAKKLQQEWFEGEAAIRDKVGLTSEDDKKDVPHTEEGMIQCQSAFCDEVAVDQAHALNCGHAFCSDCWTSYLTSQITHGSACIFATCMGMQCTTNHVHKLGCQCKEIVPEELFLKYVKDEALIVKYRRWLLDSFVEGQRGIKWCPKPGCTLAVSYQSGGTKSIQCRCGHYFCYSCLQEAHQPAPCDIVSKWLQREKSDDATEIWLQARTKECPKCNVRIEKNKACNHMTCIKCGHHFCITGDAPVALSTGVSIRLDEMQSCPSVLGYSNAHRGLVPRAVVAFLDQGVKNCVELTLSDGRTITCTHDHRILTAAGEWVEAQHLKLGYSTVTVGAQYPVVSLKEDWINCTQWTLSTASTLGFSLDMNIYRDAALAFARISGFACASRNFSTLTLTSVVDRESCVRDVQAILGADATQALVLQFNKHKQRLQLPASLSSALTSSSSSLLPAWVLDPAAPLPLLREFIAAFFAAASTASSLSIEFDAVGEVQPFVDAVGVSHSFTPITLSLPSDSNVSSLLNILDRFGIDSDTYRLVPNPDTNTLSLHTTAAFTLPFHTSIGFRYHSMLTLRISALVAFLRPHQLFQQQIQRIIAATNDKSSIESFQQARQELSLTESLLPHVMELQPATINELASAKLSLTLGESLRANDTAKFFAVTEEGKVASNSFETVILSSAASIPSSTALIDAASTLPVFHLRVESRRSVGERQVYDLTVPNDEDGDFHSFTAHSLTVHNCWLCKEAWDKHGSSTGGYYTCAKYDASVKDGKLSTEEAKNIESQRTLQKYTYYYKRYKSSWDGVALTRKMGERLEKSMKNQDIARFSFVFEAIDKLMFARRVLQWTYALAYYLKSGKKKELFEYQQDMLTQATEALQDIMDHTQHLDKLYELRKTIINQTSSIDKFRMEMVNQVEAGEFEDLLLSQADTSAEKWSCTACKSKEDYPQSVTHCKNPNCGACKLHGEPDCKSSSCKVDPNAASSSVPRRR